MSINDDCFTCIFNLTSLIFILLHIWPSQQKQTSFMYTAAKQTSSLVFLLFEQYISFSIITILFKEQLSVSKLLSSEITNHHLHIYCCWNYNKVYDGCYIFSFFIQWTSFSVYTFRITIQPNIRNINVYWKTIFI